MKKYIDLTNVMHEGMLTSAANWHPRVSVTQLGRHCYEGRESYQVSFGSHCGTHMDTPAHMIEGGTPRIDQVPLERLIGPAKIINLPKEPFSYITAEELENCGVQICKGDRIVINTGWWKKWNTKQYYPEHPAFTDESAQYLVDKGISMIALDLSGPDDPRSKLLPGQASPMHYAFLSNDIFIVEYLTNLDAITVPEFELIVLPLKFKDMDGFPVRAVAVVDE